MMIKARYISKDYSAADLISRANDYFHYTKSVLVSSHTEKRNALAKKILSLKKHAIRRGFTRGKQETLDKALPELTRAQNVYKQCIKQANHDCLEIVLKICQSVLSYELNHSHKKIQLQIESELRKLQERAALELRIPTGSKALLFNCIVKKYPDLKIIEASELQAGNFSIKTSSGILMFDWSKELKEIKNDLTKSLNCKIEQQLRTRE